MKLLIALPMAVLLIAACQPAAPAPTPAPPTNIPPTQAPPPTAIPPTKPAPATATAAIVEEPAGAMEDLVGIWWFPQGPIKIEFRSDGTYRVWDQFSGTQAEGQFSLGEGRITWLTSAPTCKDMPATYTATVGKLEGKPVQLRLVPAGDDPCGPRVDNTKGIGKRVEN